MTYDKFMNVRKNLREIVISSSAWTCSSMAELENPFHPV